MHRISPRLHWNGSGASRLVEQAMDVHRALEAAAQAMRLNYPHARDYQGMTDGGQAYRADRLEYLRRLKLVEELAEQYESEAYSISKQEV